MSNLLKEVADQGISERLNGIGEYYFSQKLREIEELNKQGNRIINLGIGSPDLPPHPSVIKVLRDEAAKPTTHAYQGYKGSAELRQAIAAWYQTWYGVTLDATHEILPLIGSKEGIMHICMTYLNPGDLVLVPNPGYPTYQSAAKIAGGEIVFYDLTATNNWLPDLELLQSSLIKAQGKRVLMFVNFPHMPTGKVADQSYYQQLVNFALDNNVLLVHDNPYSFILNEEPLSMLSVKGAKDCVIELNSLSKSHNMAGWRIGMLCGSKKHIDAVLRFKSNMDSGMFLPLQLAAAKALSLGKDWFNDLNAIYAQRKQKTIELLELLACPFEKDQAGMFVWAGIPPQFDDSYQLSDHILYKAGVFITPGGIFGSQGIKYIRISLCNPEEKLQEAINRIKPIL